MKEEGELRAAVLHGPGDLRLEEVEKPIIGGGEVLIKVKFCGICGTDPHIYTGEFPIPRVPIIPGHEFAGEVVEIGREVATVREGAHVIADINMGCGKCYFCRTNQKLLCPELKQIGVHVNGAFAEYVKVPESQIYSLPDAVKLEHASMIEPLACAISGVEKSEVKPGSSMVILGGGPMGLLLLQIAKLRGASPVILSEVVDYRREKAKELGADIVVNPKEDDLYKVVKEVTDGRGADVAIEAIGNLTTYKQAFTVVRKGGCIVAFGAAPADGTIDVSPFEIYSRELTIRASYAGTYHTWPEAISLLLWDMVRLDPLITHKLPLESIHKGYEMIKEKKHKALKILVSPEL